MINHKTILVLIILFLINTLLTYAKNQQSKIEAYTKLIKIITLVEEQYVTEYNLTTIINKTIAGLLSNLDAHSSYLNEKDFKHLQVETDGEFGGVGIVIGIKDKVLTIISPIDGTPADKVKLMSGDIILKINDIMTIGMKLDEAVSLMRGKPKTALTLTIVRKNEAKPILFNIIRDIIKVKSVHIKKIDKDLLYLRIASFDKQVSSDIKNLIKKYKKIKGIILDLRNNPGGLLNQAIEVSDLFLKKGIIVSQKGRNSKNNITYRAKHNNIITEKVPIVVLINGGSASASEIVAGALQDNKRAILLGEKTFGKGSVQVILTLDNKGKEGLKITTAKYYLPSGRTIQAIGVTPDINVSFNKVPVDKESFSIKEKDLRKHLKSELEKIDKDNNKKKKQEEKEKKKKKKSNKNILTKENINNDLQLKIAIDILKALSIYK